MLAAGPRPGEGGGKASPSLAPSPLTPHACGHRGLGPCPPHPTMSQLATPLPMPGQACAPRGARAFRASRSPCCSGSQTPIARTPPPWPAPQSLPDSASHPTGHGPAKALGTQRHGWQPARLRAPTLDEVSAHSWGQVGVGVGPQTLSRGLPLALSGAPALLSSPPPLLTDTEEEDYEAAVGAIPAGPCGCVSSP